MKNPPTGGVSSLRRHSPARQQPRGFALVISLSLMVLLTILAVGLLGLSSVSLATATRETDLAEARANARMSLALAIAQLQKQTGPDQRVTITADQLASSSDGTASAAAEDRRHWAGVYRSWPTTATTRPTPEFLTWLVSGETKEIAKTETAKTSGSGDDAVTLVGAGTVGSEPDGFVKAPALRVNSPSGGSARLAWWSGDQGTKAAMATPPVSTDESFAALRASLQAAPRNAVELADTGSEKPFKDLDSSDPRLSLVTDWQQSAFFASNPTAPRPLFHDLAPYSTGLLTNVRAGGFRKDLSMQLERSSSQAPKTPLYTVSGEAGINLQELWVYYNLYKDLKTTGGATFTTGGRIAGGTRYLELEPSAAACQNDDEFHFKQPVIVSYQMVFSFETRPVDSNGTMVNRLHLVVDPILTLWNPLDVPVVVPTTSFFSVKYWQVPYDLTISVNGAGKKTFPFAASLSGVSGDSNYLSIRVGELQQLTFKPGEVIKVSQSGDTIVRTAPIGHNLAGKSGFNYGGGVSLPVRDLNGAFLDLAANDVITYETKANNLTSGKTSSSGNSITGANQHSRHFSLMHHEWYVGADRGADSLGIGGIYMDYDFGNKRLKAAETRASNEPGTKPSGERLYADRFPEVFRPVRSQDTRPLSVAEINARKAPFMLLSFNAKTENGSDLGTRYLSRFNPKVFHVDFYDLTQRDRDMLPYEFSVEPLVSWKNRSLEVSTNGNAYFGGSMNAEFGNSFVTTHSVPREPIVSLAAFQHSFANGFELNKPKYGYATINVREPLLPQISHAIGNSMAPSMMTSDQTQGALSGGRPMADHSYLANQALWDEWMFSGIAPQTVSTFGKTRAQRVVAEDFLNGKGKLPVVRFQPDTDGSDPAKLLASFFTGATPSDAATRDIASLIRVDGLFNVNSTSVEAWKSVLGALKGRRVVVRDATGAESLGEGGKLTPVANLHSPQNVIAEGNGNIDVKEPNQWVGRRVLEDEEIDSLARAIVKEVRKRGPFLCLADFVNRRPGSDKELARAGTIQSALDAEDVEINSAFRTGTRAVGSTVSARMAFPKAEEGPAGFGSPGIVKQADILTPISPVLSARSDSFIIRSYGESVDKNGKVLARAWCEAVVERDKNFVDESDKPEALLTSLKSNANKIFGRRYEITSFRWLHPDEV
jgi:Tfp pilus assembly protein PilX